MENSKQQYTNYIHISKNESYLLNIIDKNKLIVFGVKELYRLCKCHKSSIYNTLFSLKEKGILVKIKRNRYTLKKDLNERLFEIATSTVIPSYISFWTSLSFYGFTEQQVRTVQLVSTKQEPKINFDSYHIEITTFNLKRFYGYKREGNFVIAEEEKALIDSLFQPEKCGGFTEFLHCFENALDEINKKKFIDYLIQFNNRSMISRIGYIMEELGLPTENLKRYISKSYVKLNPIANKTNKYNRSWNVILNQEIK